MTATTNADLKGVVAVTIAEGERLGTVTRVYLHRTAKTVVGFAVEPAHTLTDPDRAYLIDLGAIVSLGPDVLSIADKSAIGGQRIGRDYDSLVGLDELTGRPVMNERGERLGEVKDALLDRASLALTGISLATGSRGSQRTIPADEVTTLGAGIVIARSRAREDANGEQGENGRRSANAKEHERMNHKHLQGLAVVSIADGEKAGTVSEAWLDVDRRAIVRLDVSGGGGGLLAPSGPAMWLGADEIHAVGPDALTIDDRSKLHDEPAAEMPVTALKEVTGRKVVTEGGASIGTVASIEFNETTLELTHLEASPGFFKSNRMIPIDQVVNLGHDIVVVSDAVLAEQESSESASSSEGSAERRWVVGDIEPASRETASASSN